MWYTKIQRSITNWYPVVWVKSSGMKYWFMGGISLKSLSVGIAVKTLSSFMMPIERASYYHLNVSIIQDYSDMTWQFVITSHRLISPWDTGHFFGTTSSFGDYDECLDIQSDDDDDDHNNFVGKYCTISFKTDNTSFGPEKTPVEEKLASVYPTANFYYPISGICIPSSCSKDDVQRILLSTFPKYNLQLLNVTNCDTKESTGFNYDNTTIQQKIAMWVVIIPSSQEIITWFDVPTDTL